VSEWTVDFVMGSVKRRGERERKMKMREKDNVYSGIESCGLDGWIDGWMDGWIDGLMDGLIDR
jgi:hypothetical protein